MTDETPYEDPYSSMEELRRLRAEVYRRAGVPDPESLGPDPEGLDPDWRDLAAERIGLEHKVTFIADESIWPAHAGQYRGLGLDGRHQVAIAPQESDAWRRLISVCHELIHARSLELDGAAFTSGCDSDRAWFGNDLEGAYEVMAWEKGAELALTFYPPGYKIVHLPFIVKSRQA